MINEIELVNGIREVAGRNTLPPQDAKILKDGADALERMARRHTIMRPDPIIPNLDSFKKNSR